MKSAEPQTMQKTLSRPPSGAQPRRCSSPCVTTIELGATIAEADAAVPVRRWQLVQWQ